MVNESNCRKCSAPLTPDARDGLCPKCRLNLAYSRLRPWTEIESCQCEAVSELVLFDGLTDNPIHCATCKNEVDLERLGLSVEEIEAVARWHSVARSLYALWLDSGEYEAWAKAQLLDLSGQVNQDGLKVARMLSARLPTCLRLFRECEDKEVVDCPVCGKPLDKKVKFGSGKCLDCHVLL
jgi:hypothetical protein